MKRSSSTKGRSKSASSPYAKYGKKPYQYSAAYYTWKRQYVKTA